MLQPRLRNNSAIDKFPDPMILNKQFPWAMMVRAGFLVTCAIPLARKRDTNQYSAAKLSQPKQNVAVPMRWDTARENFVNTWDFWS